MAYRHELAMATIGQIFADVVAANGGIVTDSFVVAANSGIVTDSFEDDSLLIARSVLPRVREVRPKDRVQGGVALRANESEIWVHPYVFRQVCKNGAIMAQSIESRQIRVSDWLSEGAGEAEEALREAVHACCRDEVFADSCERMRATRTSDADLALSVLPFLAHFPRSVAANLVREILQRFSAAADSSRFGLMNAVTSVARDTADPHVRWRLEELGGGIAVESSNDPLPTDSARHALIHA